MASNGLSELLAVTNNVMKSFIPPCTAVENEVLKNKQMAIDLSFAGSPFESPRSLTSQSDSGMGKTENKKEQSFPRGIDSLRHKKFKQNSNTNNSNNNTNNNKVANPQVRKDSVDEQNSRSNKDSDTFFETSGKQKVDAITIDRNDLEKEAQSKGLDKDLDLVYNDSGGAQSMHSLKEQGKYISASTVSKKQGEEELQIIDIQARSVEMSMSSGVEDIMSCDTINPASETSQNRSGQFFPLKSFGKTSNLQYQTLKQGALSKGVMDPTQQSMFDDVYISQFHSSDQQKDIRETLAKRSENSRPKKQHVQPQIVRTNSRSGDETDRDSVRHHPSATRNAAGPSNLHEADPNVAAAVAASAAVAVTQPLLKAQQELETRMHQLLAQLSKAQEETGANKNGPDDKASRNLNNTQCDQGETNSGKRISDLERQVAELNERRLKHLESLQQQQMQMQAQLLMMSRSKSPKSYISIPARQASPQRVPQASRIPQAVTKASKGNALSRANNFRGSQQESNSSQVQSSYFNPETLSKHHNYLSEVRELQGSLLDTPAPRRTVPEPTPYSLLEEPQTNLGFLQELLNQRETPDKNTTFSIMGNKSPGFDSKR